MLDTGWDMIPAAFSQWILYGLLLGIIVKCSDPKFSFDGLLGKIVLGVGGAVLGGMIGTMLLNAGVSPVMPSAIVMAICGSLVLLLLSKTIQHY